MVLFATVGWRSGNDAYVINLSRSGLEILLVLKVTLNVHQTNFTKFSYLRLTFIASLR